MKADFEVVVEAELFFVYLSADQSPF